MKKAANFAALKREIYFFKTVLRKIILILTKNNYAKDNIR
jgi:hypothetical protein